MAKSKMLVLVPTVSVIVIRDGKRKTVEPGKPFEFTPEEVENTKRVMASAFRAPVNETLEPDDGDEDGGAAPSDEDGKTDDTAANAKSKRKANKSPSDDDKTDEDDDL